VAGVVHAGVLIKLPADLFTGRHAAQTLPVALLLLPAPSPVSQPSPVAKTVPPPQRPARKVPERKPAPVRKTLREEHVPKAQRSIAASPQRDVPAVIADAAPPAAGPAVVVDNTLVAPRVDAAYLANVPPDYPRKLLKRGIEGDVLVRAQVQPDGHCSDVQLVESSGYRQFDRAALSAVRDWRFVPASSGAHAVMAWVEVPIEFRVGRTR